MIGTIAIAGVGLIGGSFGLALRKAGFTGELLGVSSRQTITAAIAVGAISRGASLEEAAAEADLIFLSQPVESIVATIQQLGPILKRPTLITDAGSTKRSITKAAAQWLPRGAFLGGHPMAGKEVRGVQAAEADLFRNRTWILTGSAGSDRELEFREWLRRIGAKELLLDADEHDRMVAWSSHLPQLASTALAAALHDLAPEAARVAGPGLLDATRLAMSSYELWCEILDTNADQIDAVLDAYIERLRTMRTDFAGEFKKGGDFARSLRS